MTNIIEFEYADRPPGLNGSKGLMRMHWATRKKVKENLMWLIASRKYKKHKGKVTVEIVNYAIRLMDWDNLASTFKVLGDSLVKLGILEEDKPQIVVEFSMGQEKVKTKKDENLIYIIKDYDVSEHDSDRRNLH